MKYTIETKTADAAFPRSAGATTLATDRLKIVYKKYRLANAVSPPTTTINLVFAHGTGMNKSVWNAHIKRLFALSETSAWSLGSVVSVDYVSHGDSGVLNRPYLGWVSSWIDGARDLVAVVKHEIDTCNDFVPSAYSRNIVVGHSMGGFLAAYAGYLEPALFDSVIAIEPVLFYDSAFTDYFLKRVQRLSQVLRDHFSSEEDAKSWFERTSFYKDMDKEALVDFMADELTCELGLWVTKTPVCSQLSSYLCAILDVPAGQSALQHLRVPFLHIIGTSAMWNPPSAVEYIRENVPSELLSVADVEGDHLVHVTNMTDTLTTIGDFITKRAAFVTENRLNFPEVGFGNDRAAILNLKWPQLMDGKVRESVAFTYPTQNQNQNRTKL